MSGLTPFGKKEGEMGTKPSIMIEHFGTLRLVLEKKIQNFKNMRYYTILCNACNIM